MKSNDIAAWVGGTRPLMVLGLTIALGVGCASMRDVAEVAGTIGVATGRISEQEVQAAIRVADAAARAAEEITPLQEHYIGRAVAAKLLGRYRPLDIPEVNEYINLVGQALAMVSDRPETYGGYRFAVLDSDEINAFAAPGGLIFITRGMLDLCRTEDHLAAVLAHEIAHVQHRHGVQAIRTGRWTQAAAVATVEAGRQWGGRDLREVLNSFEGGVQDIYDLLVVNGYSRAAEREADATAVALLARVGYDPRAMVEMLEEMGRRWIPGGPGFMQTHPAPRDRIRQVSDLVARVAPGAPAPEARQQRFLRIRQLASRS